MPIDETHVCSNLPMIWAFLLSFGGIAAGWLAGGLYMQRIVKANAEHAVMLDHRVSRDRKAAIIARIRGLPMQYVLAEMEEARDT